VKSYPAKRRRNVGIPRKGGGCLPRVARDATLRITSQTSPRNEQHDRAKVDTERHLEHDSVHFVGLQERQRLYTHIVSKTEDPVLSHCEGVGSDSTSRECTSEHPSRSPSRHSLLCSDGFCQLLAHRFASRERCARAGSGIGGGAGRGAVARRRRAIRSSTAGMETMC